MNNELKEELRATVGAHIPAIALSSPETRVITTQTVEYASTIGVDGATGKPRRVLVWRVSKGFEEWALFVTDPDTGEESILTDGRMTLAGLDCEAKATGVVYKSDDDFPGANVPFAVDYMQSYNVDDEGRGVIFILRDWHRFVDANAEHVDQQLALFESILEGDSKTVIMLCPSRWTSENLPEELASSTRISRFPLPDKKERIHVIRGQHELYITSNTDRKLRTALAALSNDDIETFADACAGLTRAQIEDVLVMSSSVLAKWDINFVLDEKRKAVERAGFTLIRPSAGFENIGGLSRLKSWVILISRRFTQAARDYGFIRNIRGLLMAGVPGCGKTLVAKSMAHEMNMNILMVEAQDLKGSLVGESEAKVFRLLEIAKAAAPLIVFVDEAEKLLGKSEGIHDGGAHDAVLGQFLTFMQEDDSGVFFVFTANNMNKFAPELVDRFEGRFFIDLPEPEEREEIIKIHLGLRNQEVVDFDMEQLVRKTANFSGRNIEDGIEEAMTISFSEDRPLEMRDLNAVFDVLVPTSKTKKDEIEHMRSFVENGSMRKANNPRAKSSKTKSGRIDNIPRQFD